jgi:hypothetical protein
MAKRKPLSKLTEDVLVREYRALEQVYQQLCITHRSVRDACDWESDPVLRNVSRLFQPLMKAQNTMLSLVSNDTAHRLLEEKKR